jgi:hypothetical protein
MPADEAPALTVRERVLLLCVANSTDWQKAGITGSDYYCESGVLAAALM